MQEESSQGAWTRHISEFSSNSETKMATSKRFSVLNEDIWALINRMDNTSLFSNNNFPPMCHKACNENCSGSQQLQKWIYLNLDSFKKEINVRKIVVRWVLLIIVKVLRFWAKTSSPTLPIVLSAKNDSGSSREASEIRFLLMKFQTIFPLWTFTSRRYITCTKKTKRDLGSRSCRFYLISGASQNSSRTPKKLILTFTVLPLPKVGPYPVNRQTDYMQCEMRSTTYLDGMFKTW